MSDILSHGAKQIVLYSKWHFVSTDMIEDLRVITAKHFEIPIESTMFYHVYDFVTGVFIKLHEAKYMDESIEKFLTSLFTWETPVLKPEDMLRKMMGRIQGVEAAGLNLGEADEKYLPTKQPQVAQ